MTHIDRQRDNKQQSATAYVKMARGFLEQALRDIDEGVMNADVLDSIGGCLDAAQGRIRAAVRCQAAVDALTMQREWNEAAEKEATQ